eukprot:m.17119 g.17119  ORF g.17119 m.17119 type:complete len:82 (+) comp7316_c0_seq1:63-308(+)
MCMFMCVDVHQRYQLTQCCVVEQHFVLYDVLCLKQLTNTAATEYRASNHVHQTVLYVVHADLSQAHSHSHTLMLTMGVLTW